VAWYRRGGGVEDGRRRSAAEEARGHWRLPGWALVARGRVEEGEAPVQSTKSGAWGGAHRGGYNGGAASSVVGNNGISVSRRGLWRRGVAEGLLVACAHPIEGSVSVGKRRRGRSLNSSQWWQWRMGEGWCMACTSERKRTWTHDGKAGAWSEATHGARGGARPGVSGANVHRVGQRVVSGWGERKGRGCR
jgi:hypothetical protein